MAKPTYCKDKEMSNGEIFSAFANALPVASAVTANTRLTGVESNGPTAQTYEPTTAGAANSLVATDANGQVMATHFLASGMPTVAVGPLLGAGSSATISGTDASMQVSVTGGSGNGTVLFTVTFANAFATAPFPTFSCCSNTTAAQLVTHQFFISATTTTLTITMGFNSISNGTVYTFNIRT
jgi:hypothetical protein